MHGGRLPASEHRPVSIAHANSVFADAGGLFAQIEDSILVPGYVIRTAHVGPHTDELAIRREDLHASVGAIAHIEGAVGRDRQTVRQMKVSGRSLPRLPPGLNQFAILGETVHPAVTVAIGH